jgi:hypothetical protein
VHSVIVLHVVIVDDYWPFRTAVSPRVDRLHIYQFPCVSSRSVAVPLSALYLAIRPKFAIRSVIENCPRAASLSSQPRTYA